MSYETDTKKVILDVQNLNTSFISDKKEIKIVKDVSFQLKRGTCLAVVGESGCGKSVTMNSIMRFTGKNSKVTADKIQYNALENDKVMEYHLEKVEKPNGPAMRALRGPHMSMVFQDPMSSLNPVYRVGDQVAEGLLQHNKGMKKAEAREKVLEMFKKLGIPDPENRMNSYPHEFSGGQRQRLCIARALEVHPEVLVCDEPVSALDVSIQAQVLNLMKEIQKDMNLTYLFIAHDLSVVQYMSDRIVVMYLGKVVEIADSKALYDEPLHPYTQALLSAIPVPDIHKTKKRQILEGEVPSPINKPSGCAFHNRCPKCMDICKTEDPALYNYDGKDHCVACHLYRNNANH